MFLPTRQIASKSRALEELYDRIARVAFANGGNSARLVVNVEFMGGMDIAPRSEPTPALHVNMPDGFQVVFVPTSPLSIGQILVVRASRSHKGRRKSDRSFNFGSTGWQMGPFTLQDIEIRGCLAQEAPPSMYSARATL